MEEDKNIDYLLNKYRENSISKEELNLLRFYFNNKQSSYDLNAYFDKVWNDKYLTDDRFDVEKNFQEIQSELNIGRIESRPDNTKIRKLLFKAISYAAIFIIGFGVFFLYNVYKEKSQPSINGKYVTVTIPYGSKSKIDLPDGSHVTLNSGSYLKYPITFGTNSRNVEFEGEAYFDIHENKKVPFVVSTSGIHIKVLGTTFNVKSYPEDKSIETTLVTGAIEIFNKKNKKQQAKHIYLKPNQKISIPKKNSILNPNNNTTPKAIKLENIASNTILETNIDPINEIAWKDNKLVFDNEKFSSIMVKLERWYDVSIEIHSPKIVEERFSGKFEKETLQQSLEALSLIAPIRYTIDKKKVGIYNRP